MRWLALEANPEVMTSFVHELGVNKEEVSFYDIYSTDPELLPMFPQPEAVIMIFPITPKYEEHFIEEQQKLKNESTKINPSVFFVRQTISNACGTIALVHAICNNADRISLGDGFFRKFLTSSQSKTADERAALLEEDQTLSQTHEEMAQRGQSRVIERDKELDLHFICFVEKDGQLYELDGRKQQPICHGPSSSETLLEDAVTVARQFMSRDPENNGFTLIGMTKAPIE